MQVVKVTLTPTDTVFSQENGTRDGDVMRLDADYTFDHSHEGFEFFQNFRFQDRGVILNGRMMGDTVVVSSRKCLLPDVTSRWDSWTTHPDLPPPAQTSDAGIRVSHGAVCKKSRKAEEPMCEENDESVEEEDESDEDDAIDGDDADQRGLDVVVE